VRSFGKHVPALRALTLVINFAFFSGIISCSRYLMGIFWFFDMSDMLMAFSIVLGELQHQACTVASSGRQFHGVILVFQWESTTV